MKIPRKIGSRAVDSRKLLDLYKEYLFQLGARPLDEVFGDVCELAVVDSIGDAEVGAFLEELCGEQTALSRTAGKYPRGGMWDFVDAKEAYKWFRDLSGDDRYQVFRGILWTLKETGRLILMENKKGKLAIDMRELKCNLLNKFHEMRYCYAEGKSNLTFFMSVYAEHYGLVEKAKSDESK